MSDLSRLAPTPTVSIIGGSVRAAAFSALRAGLQPWCLDLFADADLSAFAPTTRCPFADYPDHLMEMLKEAPPGPVIYTGGLENHPRLIEQIAAVRPLWGNDAEALRRCRDPFFVAGLLDENEIRRPALRFIAPRLAASFGRARKPLARSSRLNAASWLRKPVRGAGGTHISFATGDDSESAAVYYQEFIPGPSFSAVFRGFENRTEFLGITEQLTGEPWLDAKPFAYCGSIGPANLTLTVQNTLMRMGGLLRSGCGLRGLFGIDFILNDDHPWVVEVNPRYTASIEVLEHATGLRALQRLRFAFADSPQKVEPALRSEDSASRLNKIGKAILFAESRLTFPEHGPWTIQTDPFARPDFADIPHAGEVIEEGWPILTFFADAPTAEECREELKRRARTLKAALISSRIGSRFAHTTASERET